MDFSQLFKTAETVASGVGTGVFTITHFIVFSLEMLLIYLLARRFKRSERTGREKMLTSVAIFVLVNEVLKDLYLVGLGQIKWGHLPFHLCGINVIMITIYWLFRNQKVAEWIYAMSLPGGLIALISPDWAELPLLNIMYWQTNTIHSALVLFPILLLIDGFRPNSKRFLKVVPWLLAMGAVIYPLNKILNTNFLFMNWAPKGTPFEMFEAWMGNPGYLVAFTALFALTWYVMYLPWRKSANPVKELV